MNISKKTLIIIAIVVVIVGFLVWKHMRDNQDPDTATSTSSSKSVDEILTAIGAESNVKSYVRSVVHKINASSAWKQDVIGKAKNNGLTFNQQAVLEALWVMYKDQDAEGNPKISWSVMDRLAEKVRNL